MNIIPKRMTRDTNWAIHEQAEVVYWQLIFRFYKRPWASCIKTNINTSGHLLGHTTPLLVCINTISLLLTTSIMTMYTNR